MIERCEILIVPTVVAEEIAKTYFSEGRIPAIVKARHFQGVGSSIGEAKEIVEFVMEGCSVRTYGPDTVFSRGLLPQVIERHMEVE